MADCEHTNTTKNIEGDELVTRCGNCGKAIAREPID